MTSSYSAIGTISFLLWSSLCAAQSCQNNPTGKGPTVVTAHGYQSEVVTNSLQYPRGMIFDSAGHLLVVDRGVGIKALTLQDDGGPCVTVSDSKLVISESTLNHGIELSSNGKILYASSVSALFAWGYDPANAQNTTASRTIVNGMYNTDHSTRTILRSKKKVGTVVLNRGSQSNIDPLAFHKKNGHGQVKAFDLTKLGNDTYDFTADGDLIAWGIRNDVGIAEHPVSGGIWTVENSVDEITRNGQNFHNRNPGEKLNYMGTLVGNQSPNQGSNFGYPYCYAAWDPKQIPDYPGLQRGEQFTIRPDKVSDKACRNKHTAPSLVFDAHMAPLDIKFSKNTGKNAYVTFHGSHDRDVPKGYKLSKIAYNSDHMPVEPSTSAHALHDLIQVKDKSSCPGSCMRPVAMAFDKKDRLFFSSDYTGEIYVLTKNKGKF